MNRLKQLRTLGLCALFALALAGAPSMARADGDGKEHHETHRNTDGTWTRTDTKKDGSKTETQMDKDRHKTKETEYDAKGKVIRVAEWKWNDKEKQDVKRGESRTANGNTLKSEDEWDENGVLVKKTVWFDNYVIVDTYVAGKRVKREKTIGGVTKTTHFDKDGRPID